MRALIQRVSSASVKVEGTTVGGIERGLLVLLGLGPEDDKPDRDWLLQKIIKLRIFSDDAGLMNLSLEDIQGSLLIVSQFTLHAKLKKGNRPSYAKAAPPEIAKGMYQAFIEEAQKQLGPERVSQGEFGANMQVALVNDGPVTLWIDTQNKE